MTMILLLLTLLIAGVWMTALARTVRRDGLGSRRPPRSHLEWWEGAEPR
ncbi:hypothetical protein [Isoptericola haloaureus]|uniref:Uncharacterized protein n=1 Tax=Isoptericola haloaureus TaxID=1542902 RepID=A0ABU7ZAE1_9MICO